LIVAQSESKYYELDRLEMFHWTVDTHTPSILPPESFTRPIQELEWPARVMFPLKLGGLKEVSTAVQGRLSPYYSLLQRTEKDHITVLFNVYIC